METGRYPDAAGALPATGMPMRLDYQQAWQEAVASLVARHGAVEVAAASPPKGGGPMHVDRCRLLRVTPSGELLIERPAEGGMPAMLTRGMEMIVTAAHRGHRWEGHCRVIRSESFRPNEGNVVLAIRLSAPERIESGQRRRFFRVPIGAGDASLELCVISTDDRRKKPGFGVLEPALLNLSGGGVGVSVALSPQVGELLRSSRAYRCVLRVSGHDEPLDLAARLIHVEPLPHNRIYLGLEFLFEDAAERRQVQDLLTRAATEIERRQLRRHRRA